MAKKFQVPVLGGLRKVIQPAPTVAPGTTIAGLGGQTITLQQLAALIGAVNAVPNTQTNSPTAALILGPGLSGGGPLIGAVAINLTAPPFYNLEGDYEAPMVFDGVQGQQGLQGLQGMPGMPGLDGEDTEYILPNLSPSSGFSLPLTTKGDLLYEDATPAPARLAIGTSGQVLTVSGGLPVWETPTAVPTSANPSASIGLSVVNGSATTYMRSDAAPALNQGISPTWTGFHTFNNLAFNNAYAATANSGYTLSGDISTNPLDGAYIQVFAPGFSFLPGGAVIGTGGSNRLTGYNDGHFVLNAPTAGIALSISAVANENALSLVGASNAGESFGLAIQAGTSVADSALTIADYAGAEMFKVSGIGIVAATKNSISSYVGPAAAWQFDSTGNGSNTNQVTLAVGASLILPLGSGLIYLYETSGLGMGYAFLVFGSAYVTNVVNALFSSGFPAGSVDIGYNGTNYVITNNYTTPVTLVVTSIRLRSSN